MELVAVSTDSLEVHRVLRERREAGPGRHGGGQDRPGGAQLWGLGHRQPRRLSRRPALFIYDDMSIVQVNAPAPAPAPSLVPAPATAGANISL